MGSSAMAKSDVLPDAHGSRALRSEVARLVAAAEHDSKPQRQKFEDLARELEADEDPAHFEEMVRKIAPTKAEADKEKDT